MERVRTDGSTDNTSQSALSARTRRITSFGHTLALMSTNSWLGSTEVEPGSVGPDLGQTQSTSGWASFRPLLPSTRPLRQARVGFDRIRAKSGECGECGPQAAASVCSGRTRLRLDCFRPTLGRSRPHAGSVVGSVGPALASVLQSSGTCGQKGHCTTMWVMGLGELLYACCQSVGASWFKLSCFWVFK